MGNSVSELEELLLKYKSETDFKKRRIAYLNLVSEALKLVKKIAYGFTPLPASVSVDDLIQVGALGVLKAIDFYECGGKGNFKAYAILFVKGRILHYLRDKANVVKPPRNASVEEVQKIKNIESLDRYVFSPDGAETMLDRIPAQNYEEIFENKKLIEFALNKLAKNEKEVIYKYYIEGLKKKEIAQMLNISAMQVSRLIKKSLNKMYNILEKDIKES